MLAPCRPPRRSPEEGKSRVQRGLPWVCLRAFRPNHGPRCDGFTHVALAGRHVGASLPLRRPFQATPPRPPSVCFPVGPTGHPVFLSTVFGGDLGAPRCEGPSCDVDSADAARSKGNLRSCRIPSSAWPFLCFWTKVGRAAHRVLATKSTAPTPSTHRHTLIEKVDSARSTAHDVHGIFLAIPNRCPWATH